MPHSLTFCSLLLTKLASSTRTRSRKRTSAKKITTAERIAAAVDKQEAVKPVVKSKPIPVEVVTKYTPTTEKVKVTETPKPASKRPEKPTLTWEDYSQDFKVRWQIHQYETQELWNDLVKGYQLAVPYGKKVVDFSVESYNKVAKKVG